MKRNIGYLLPPGDAFEEELACALVFYPDRDEYRRALLGSIAYLETWLAWERDDDKRAIDAAESWKLANEKTMECWVMACLETLQANVAAILALLQNNVPCCGDTITYGDSTVYITTIIPGDGGDPDYYGETAVSDWDEWKEYVCHHANLWVDELVSNAESIETALAVGGLTIALVSYAIAAIAYYVIGGSFNASATMLYTVNMIAGYTIGLFSDAAQDIEDARDSIVCAIVGGFNVADAIETALSSGTAWDLFYQHIDYDSAMAIIYEGGDGDSVYLDPVKDDSCDCLCLHFYSETPEFNPVIYQSSAGAQFQMQIREAYGYDSIIAGTFRFNRKTPTGWCGPFKIIDSVSVDDALDFTALGSFQYGVPENEWGPDDPQACNYDITLLEDEEVSSIWIHRNTPAYDGCAVGTITITITYHDA